VDEALTLRVSAGGFASADGTTRATDNGYTTSFAAGDRIGVFAVANGTVQGDNVAYSYDGSQWTAGGNPVYLYPGGSYFAYYPYDPAMNGMTSQEDILAAFTPATDQSMPGAYTASDLMTGAGALSGATLNITLAHALSLLEVSLPKQKYSINSMWDYDRHALSPAFKIENSTVTPCNTGNGVYRYLLKPGEGSVTVSGTYSKDAGAALSYSKTGVVFVAGQYIRLNVTHEGMETPIPRDLAVGDYHYADGSVSPGNEPPLDGCDGIVFQVGGSGIKIVSLDHVTEKVWSMEDIVTGATDENDGQANMAKIKAIPGWETKYPAFQWCADKGDGWYLPAKCELENLHSTGGMPRDEFDARLETAGGVALYTYDSQFHYSSTETAYNTVFLLELKDGGAADYLKSVPDYYIRAIKAF
jgi:hypothetical protein